MECVMPQIINLSSIKLNAAQIKLLGKGLKYTPTPNSNDTLLACDLKELGRKLRLREYFSNINGNNDAQEECENINIFKNKSSFNPPRGRDKILDTTVETLTRLADNLQNQQKPGSKKSNLSKEEWQALNELKNNDKIVIKEADKGSSVVIMDSDYYAEKMTNMLSDQDTYEELKQDTSKHILSKIKSLVNQADIPKDTCEFLTRFELKCANLYGLPKIHKSKCIMKAIEEQQSSYIETLRPCDLKFRPIVAGPCNATHRLSKLIDFILKPFTRFIPSYIRDDIDFLNKLPRKVGEIGDGILSTFDVVSLYTNIDHELGIEAIRYWIDKYPTSLPEEYSSDFVIQAVKLILENNIFMFNDKYYGQVSGTAMGTQMAPTYATLTMGYLEVKLYQSLEDTKGIQYAVYVQNSWKRYLDDCFIYWPHCLGNIKDFHAILDNLHPKINFTLEYSDERIPFLDILLIKTKDIIESDLYYKTTDSHNYVPFQSCHPHHTKTNIPYTLSRRICTIVDDPTKIEHRLQEMKTFLINKGYPVQIINDAITRAKDKTQSDLRNPTLHAKNKSEQSTLAFVTTHNPNNQNVDKCVKNALVLLSSSERMNSIMADTRIIKSKRQPPNLKRMLTSAKFSSNVTCSIKKCGDKRCKCCDHLIEGDSIVLENGKRFQVKTSMDCNSTNLLYILQCCGCKKQYIGETGDILRNRIRVHRQHVRNESVRMLQVSAHFDKCAKCEPYFRVFPFYKLQNDSVFFRREKEKYFIDSLKPSLNA